MEYELIAEALKQTRGNQSKAAQQLGITERIMGLRIENYGFDSSRYR
ncbi:MAG: helix-turn-helix domain-containing protein [Sphaerochaetaceae bacterium]|nr:helix-turn-helix domain-containing protein [Sphaerochaetaceae bacterium]